MNINTKYIDGIYNLYVNTPGRWPLFKLKVDAEHLGSKVIERDVRMAFMNVTSFE